MEPNVKSWATYLAMGVYEHGDETFWEGVRFRACRYTRLTWQKAKSSRAAWFAGTTCRSDPGGIGHADRGGGHRGVLSIAVAESTKLDSVSDVPVGVNLSGGLDSSALLGLIQQLQGADSDVKAFTFVTGDRAV